MKLTKAHVLESLYAHQDVVETPDPGSLSLTPHATGSHSHALLTTYTSRNILKHLVVRTPNSPDSPEDYYRSYQNEYSIRMGIPAAFTYQPQPYFVAKEPVPHAVEAYIEGTHPSPDGRWWTERQIATLGSTIAKLHMATKRPTREGEQDRYAMLLQRYQAITGATLQLSMDTPAADYMDTLNTQATATLCNLAEKLPPNNTEVLDHNDLIAFNIINNKGTLYFIDWANAHLTDPAQGIAISYATLPLSADDLTLNFSPSQAKLLTTAYQESTDYDPTLLKRVKIWRSAIHTTALIKLAGIFYNPHAPHLWKPKFEDQHAVSQLLEAMLSSKGYSLPPHSLVSSLFPHF